MSYNVRRFDELPVGVIVTPKPAVQQPSTVGRVVVDGTPVLSDGAVHTLPPQIDPETGKPVARTPRYYWEQHYNWGLAVCYGVLFIIFGFMLIALGVLSQMYWAYWSTVSIGIWFGILTVVTGAVASATSCVRRRTLVFVYLAASMAMVIGGIIFTIMFAVGAYFDDNQEDEESWGCKYGYDEGCGVYEKWREPMVIVNAVSSAISFLVMLFGILSMVVSVQPWIAELRPTEGGEQYGCLAGCCQDDFDLCKCCCVTPYEEQQGREEAYAKAYGAKFGKGPKTMNGVPSAKFGTAPDYSYSTKYPIVYE